VLLQKPRSPLETYNDLDGNVVNFFRVLRDQPDELIRVIRLTPWARAEYELSLEPCEDVVERARRFFVCHMLGVKQSLNTTLGQFRLKVEERASGVIPILHNLELEVIAIRFCRVQIEQMPCNYVIRKCDREDTLFYVDPPYPAEERTHGDVYLVEFSQQDHVSTAALLRSCIGYVVVSGYACPLYTDLYEAHGWTRVDKEAQTNSGGKRIESLWLSPRTVDALGVHEQLDFF